jgi:outer membrane protein OmpA-like peptidoglycan-associated protein
MNRKLLFLGTLLCLLMTGRLQAQQGLKGDYYNGTNFEYKVLTRTDPQIHFDWSNHSPATGIGKSYYSIRWTGQLLAPVSGRYLFSANVDDGIRVWVGNRKVIDAWGLHDSVRFKGAVILEAGKYYDIRIDYFNDLLGGVIELLWQPPNDIRTQPPLVDAAGKPLTDPNVYQPIGGQYLYQRRPPPSAPVVVAPKAERVKIPKNRVITPSKRLIEPRKYGPAVAAPIPEVAVVLPEKKPEPQISTPPKAGSVLTVKQILFEQSTWVLLPESFAELDSVVALLRQLPTVRIEVVGHTDNVGDARLNQSLSEYRARVVRHYLIGHGIAEDRIEANGYGGSRPDYGNDTEADRARNRRVEFVIK